jgi:hypothetical protein
MISSALTSPVLFVNRIFHPPTGRRGSVRVRSVP